MKLKAMEISVYTSYRILAGLTSQNGLLPLIPCQVSTSSKYQTSRSGDRYLFHYVKSF